MDIVQQAEQMPAQHAIVALEDTVHIHPTPHIMLHPTLRRGVTGLATAGAEEEA